MGMDAAEVFPMSSMSITARSGPNPSRSPTALMMRALAWWGISRSTSSAWTPALSSSSRQALVMDTTACLNTSLPDDIRILSSPATRSSAVAGRSVPPAGMVRRFASLPSAASDEARTPGSSDGTMTVAPAPSPNSTQVVRSVKSSLRESTSAPTTSTVSDCPDTIIPVASDVA